MKTVHYSLFSFSLHIVLLLLVGVVFQFKQNPINLGDNEVRVVRSYLYVPKQEMSQVVKQALIEKGIALKKIVKAVSKQRAQPLQNQSSQGQQVDALLLMLHTAIQAQQRYPQHALEMEREGKVTLGFVLLVDGRVRNVKVLNSSGTESLDQAAQEALNRAAPFVKAKNYIKQAGEYSIDVSFELA